MELQELLQIVAALLSAFLVTEGVKSLDRQFGAGRFEGFKPALTAFMVTLIVLFGELLVGQIPVEYADEAANIAKSILAVLSAFGIHRTAARIGSVA